MKPKYSFILRKKNSNATPWPPEKIKFLKDNINTLTNQQLATKLEMSLTVCRNKIYELGLQRSKKPKTWKKTEENYLLRNYKIMGNVELAENLNTLLKKPSRIFDNKTINKKLRLLKITRTEEQLVAIMQRNYQQKRYSLKKAFKALKAKREKVILAASVNLKKYARQLREKEQLLAKLQGPHAPYIYTRWEIENLPKSINQEIYAIKRKIFLLPDRVKPAEFKNIYHPKFNLQNQTA